jgi:hypothetical protein
MLSDTRQLAFLLRSGQMSIIQQTLQFRQLYVTECHLVSPNVDGGHFPLFRCVFSG